MVQAIVAQAISLKVALLPRVHLFVVLSLFCIHVRQSPIGRRGSLSMHQRDGCRSFVVPVHLLFDGPELGGSSSRFVRLPNKLSNDFRSAFPESGEDVRYPPIYGSQCQIGGRQGTSAVDFGQLFFRLRPMSTLANFWMLHFWTTKGGAPKGAGEKVGSETWGPEGWGPEGWGCEGWGAQNFALFFPSPATVFNLFSLSCWSFRGILVV